jgi:hypothetical protein
MSTSGASLGALLVVAAVLPAVDLGVLRLLGARWGGRRGPSVGPVGLGVTADQFGTVLVILLADLFAVAVVAFLLAGSSLNRALALVVLLGIAVLALAGALYVARRGPIAERGR